MTEGISILPKGIPILPKGRRAEGRIGMPAGRIVMPEVIFWGAGFLILLFFIHGIDIPNTSMILNLDLKFS